MASLWFISPNLLCHWFIFECSLLTESLAWTPLQPLMQQRRCRRHTSPLELARTRLRLNQNDSRRASKS
nr:hypothetical protein HmN_000924500 [Hymenolepis microstoma]